MEEPIGTAARTHEREAALELAWEVCEGLAESIGPRRPCSRSERVAAEWLRGRLARDGVEARLESFAGHATFALPHGAVLGLGTAPALLPRRLRRPRAALAALATLVGVLEDDLRVAPLARAFARLPSQNVVAEIEPARAARRTVCVMAHVDTSRSGTMFHPRLAPHLRRLILAMSAALALQGAEGAIGRRRGGRGAVALARATLAAGLALLAERELRGVDVPGANDNSSGSGVAAALAAEVARRPLDSTRLVLLVTGCEESGTHGARAFLEAHDTTGWLFLNFDGVAAPATLRYLPFEGITRRWPADAGLVELVERVAAERPELAVAAADPVAGLTYDATQVLARGGRAITISAQDGTIPNYHWPTDTLDNADRDVLARALELGRELLVAIDRGEADGPRGPG